MEKQQVLEMINCKVIFNEDKKGLELHFSDKPSQEIREQIKSNGFRWSKYQKMWFAKDTEERRNFLQGIGFANENNSDSIEIKKQTEYNYPEIDINDIVNYTIDKNTSKRENNNSFLFRTKERDHQQEIQELFQSWNNEIIEILDKTNDKSIIYYAKKKLQSIKKKYYDIYVKMLNHKANNPSWAVTGRGNLNTQRYNKKQSQYENMMGLSVGIYNEYKELADNTKWKISNDNRKKKQQNFNKLKENTRMDGIKFNRIKTNIVNDNFKLDHTCTIYEYDNYYIVSNYWGAYRIYNEKGKELHNSSTLKDAKLSLVTMLENNLCEAM